MKLEHKTKRLIIRPLKQSDFEAWKAYYSRKSVKSKNTWDDKRPKDSTLTKSHFNKVLKSQKSNIKNDQYYDLKVFIKKTGELIGGVSAMNVLRSVSQSAFLGYRIDNRYWGQGYGKEAVHAMTTIAFKELKLHRLEAGIEPSNKRSIRLVKSLGYRHEGKKKNVVFLRGDWQDLSIYSITSEEFGVKWKGSIKMRLH